MVQRAVGSYTVLALTVLSMQIPEVEGNANSFFAWPSHGLYKGCATQVNATVMYYTDEDSGGARVGISVVLAPKDLREPPNPADACYVYGSRTDCCDFQRPGCQWCEEDDVCNQCSGCTHPESFQCYSYTEAHATLTAPASTPAPAPEFKHKCMSSPKEERFETEWLTLRDPITKFYEPAEVFLEAALPGGAEAAAGLGVQLAVAFSTCSEDGGCFEQFLFGEAGLEPVVLNLTLPAPEAARPARTLPGNHWSCGLPLVEEEEEVAEGEEGESEGVVEQDGEASGEDVVKAAQDVVNTDRSSGGGGADLGAILALDWVVAIFCVVFVCLAASLFFDSLKMELPMFVVEWLNKASGMEKPSVDEGRGAGCGSNTYLLAWVRGLVFGLIVSPCVGPFAASILVYVATTGNLAVGAVGLFFFALGLSTLLLMVALSAGLAARLPQPGPWLQTLKRHSAFVVLVMACIFLNNLDHKPTTAAAFTATFLSWILFTVLSCLLENVPVDELPVDEMLARADLSWLQQKLPVIKRRQEISARRVRLTAGFVVCQILAYYIVWSYSVTGIVLPPRWPPSKLVEEPPSDIPWVYRFEDALLQAAEEGKPVFIDFYATWCIPCRKMDYTTLRDDQVVALAQQHVSYKADCTKTSSAAATLKSDVWGIRSMPAYAFLTAERVAAFRRSLPAATTADTLEAALALNRTALPWLEPDVVLDYAQSAGKMASVMRAVLAGDVSDIEEETTAAEEFDNDVVKAILLCYAWGLLASLTPCVYPMIPTTLALFYSDAAAAAAPASASQKHLTEYPSDKSLTVTNPVTREDNIEANYGDLTVSLDRQYTAQDLLEEKYGKSNLPQDPTEINPVVVKHGFDGTTAPPPVSGTGSAAGGPPSRWPIIAKALLYSLGIAVTYTTLGIVVTVAL